MMSRNELQKLHSHPHENSTMNKHKLVKDSKAIGEMGSFGRFPRLAHSDAGCKCIRCYHGNAMCFIKCLEQLKIIWFHGKLFRYQTNIAFHLHKITLYVKHVLNLSGCFRCYSLQLCRFSENYLQKMGYICFHSTYYYYLLS